MKTSKVAALFIIAITLFSTQFAEAQRYRGRYGYRPRTVVVVPARPVYVAPRPVYVVSRPVYARPRRVYVAPRRYYRAPRPVYVVRQPHRRRVW